VKYPSLLCGRIGGDRAAVETQRGASTEDCRVGFSRNRVPCVTRHVCRTADDEGGQPSESLVYPTDRVLGGRAWNAEEPRSRGLFRLCPDTSARDGGCAKVETPEQTHVDEGAGERVPGRTPAFAPAFIARLGGWRDRLSETGRMVQPSTQEMLANDFYLSSGPIP
jgi:hypothetical protein